MENNLQKEIDLMAKAIKTDNYPMSIGELSNLYQDGDLKINPIYQRMFRWDITQQSALIESILLNIPIPPIYVYQNEKGKWNLIDGQQRLSTIFKFMGILKKYSEGEDENKLVDSEPLTCTKFLPSLEGKYWDNEDESISLTDAQRRYIKRAKILIIIIDKSSDEFAQYEMFQRLNTGGSHLSPQEIRNCILVMKNEEIYKKLRNMSKYSNFINAVPISEKDSEEQGYLELVVKYFVLRYSKFEISDSENYNNFLTDEILNLINKNSIDYEKEEVVFKKTFDLLYEVMDENSFKKYDQEKSRSCGAVLVGAYEAVIPGLTENIDYYMENKADLEQMIKDIYSADSYLAATKRGIRPIGRIKRLVEFSKEIFLRGE